MATFPIFRTQITRISAPHLRRDLDLIDDELAALLDIAVDMKQSPRDYAHALDGKYLGLLFEKASLRTRLTFELAIKQLGGDAVFTEGPIGAREPIKDIARNLDRWVDAIVARTFSQDTIDELARWSAVPVINALSDLYHPCQVLADMLTLKERFDDLAGLKLAFCGDGNNVAHSLMLTCARLGIDFAIAAPNGYEPNPEILAQADGLAAVSGATLQLTSDPAEAVDGAHAVYTDVWTSMGQEKESAKRRKAFADYQVNETLFALARPDAVFMHCLPAHREEEVTDSVIEHNRSVVFDQAENRLHAQKALLLMMLG
ncbi:MAG TPA: ornithine carbamoyltransferase [Bryobacteraceae bacterium]|jgi:ornithine carbamoyltransferase|nr:ornithine carbamoyltransferase [Bryobacteraceae bacterium]